MYNKQIHKYITAIVVCCLLLAVNIVSAQNWKDDLKAMADNYGKASAYEMKTTVSLYESAKSLSPVTSYTGYVVKSGDNYYSCMMDKVTLQNENFRLMVDKRQRIIAFKHSPEKKEPTLGVLPPMIDSMIYSQLSGAYVTNNATEKKIVLISRYSGYEKVIITINPVDNTLRQMVLYEKKMPGNATPSAEKIVIDYSDVYMNKKYAQSYFSEKKYVSIKGEKAVASSAYKQYRIIDQD